MSIIYLRIKIIYNLIRIVWYINKSYIYLGGEIFILNVVCDSNLNNIFYILKTILDIIMIIAPILAIVSLAMHIFEEIIDPDNKKNIQKLKNTIKALMIIFIIPLLINIVTLIIGEKTSLTSCWNNTRRSSIKIKYYDKKENTSKKTKVYTDSKNYHGKTNASGIVSNNPNIFSNLNFTCKSKIVKAQFSCDTLSIVEKHLYELNANNFYNVINSYGGFDAYAKNVGGIFGEYYGKEMPHETTADFQRAAEYVIGWMYMYGWTYWGSPKVFWKNGFYEKYDKSKVQYYNDGHKKQYEHFDPLVSGQRGVNYMATACGELEIFAYDKMGISRKERKQLPKVARLRDLKPGDAILFFNEKVPDKLNEKTWNFGSVRHNVIVGEVYNDRVVIYDVGSYFPKHQNYKRTIYFPNEAAGETDMDAIRKEYSYYGKNVDWAMRRWYDFK